MTTPRALARLFAIGLLFCPLGCGTRSGLAQSDSDGGLVDAGSDGGPEDVGPDEADFGPCDVPVGSWTIMSSTFGGVQIVVPDATSVWVFTRPNSLHRWVDCAWTDFDLGPVLSPTGGGSAIWATGRDDVWLAGSNSKSDLLVHGNGVNWDAPLFAEQADRVLVDRVWGISKDDLWLTYEKGVSWARYGQIARCTTGGCNPVPLPFTTGRLDVRASASAGAWLCCGQGTDRESAIMRWDGGAWKAVANPVGSAYSLEWVSSGEVWARMQHLDGAGFLKEEVYWYDLREWHLAFEPPTHLGLTVLSLWAKDPRDVWISDRSSHTGVIQRWDGSSLLASGTFDEEIVDLAGTPDGRDIWAVSANHVYRLRRW